MLYLLNKEPREPVSHLLVLIAVPHGDAPHAPGHPLKHDSCRFSSINLVVWQSNIGQFKTIGRDKTGPPIATSFKTSSDLIIKCQNYHNK